MPFILVALKFTLIALSAMLLSTYAEAIIKKRDAQMKLKNALAQAKKYKMKQRFFPRTPGGKVINFCPGLDEEYFKKLDQLIDDIEAKKIPLKEADKIFDELKGMSSSMLDYANTIDNNIVQLQNLADEDFLTIAKRIDVGEVIRKRGLWHLGAGLAWILTLKDIIEYAEAVKAYVELAQAQECYLYYKNMEKAPDFGAGCGHGQGTPEVIYNPFGEPMIFQIDGFVDDDITINGAIWRPHPNPADDGQFKRGDCPENSAHNFSTWFVVGENEKTLINYQDNQGANMGAEYWITMYTLEEGMKYARPPKY